MNPSIRYPRYTVNGKDFGTDYDTANLFWQSVGGVLVEKLDPMTPAYVLQSNTGGVQ